MLYFCEREKEKNFQKKESIFTLFFEMKITKIIV
jgi:hypothetical protein